MVAEGRGRREGGSFLRKDGPVGSGVKSAKSSSHFFGHFPFSVMNGY